MKNKRLKYKTSFAISLFLIAVVALGGCNNSSVKPVSGGLDFYSLNVQDDKVVETFETAKANGKNVLLIFDAVWCGYCRKLNQETMKAPEVETTLANFEVVNVDIDKYPTVLRAFPDAYKKGVPLIMLFSSEGIQTDEIGGYMPAKPFNEVLKKNL